MRSFTVEELATLSPAQAVASRFDERNLRLLRGLPLAFLFLALIPLFERQRVGWLQLVSLALLVGLHLTAFLAARRCPRADEAAAAPGGPLAPMVQALRERPRAAVLTFLASHFVLLGAGGYGSTALVPITIVQSLLLIAFRFQASERIALHGALALAVILSPAYGAGPGPAAQDEPPPRVALLLSSGFGLGVGLLATRRARREILGRFSESQELVREQLRMRRELDYAREMQLAMLPGDCPAPAWLDVCSLSLPATEVGGDYYDYFDLADGRWTVVVGDVAGHGMASGLLLAGVRSSLTLLADEHDDAGIWLERLHRMVQRTSRRRTLVTLAAVTFDARDGSAEVVSAGHPPGLLRRAASGRAEEVTVDSLPLGVNLPAAPARRSLVLVPGDVLLLLSDGLYETTDAAGEAFGFARLAAAFEEVGGRASSQAIRDGLLQALWSFKGDAAPADDITFVVVRVKAPATV